MSMNRNLSDILGEIYVRSAQWTRVELKGGIGIQIPRGKQIAVHFILDGHPLMSAKSRFNFPLRPGDAMIVLDRQPHAIMNRAGARIHPFDPAQSSWVFGDTADLAVTDDGPDAGAVSSVLLTGIFRVRWPPELSQWRLLPPVLHGNRNFKTEAAGREAVEVFEQLASRPGGPTCVTRYVEFLLVRELQQVLERSPGLLRASASRDVQMEQALAAISRDPAAAWSVAALARHVGMSRSTFAEKFLEYVGVTPMALVFQHRMELAAQYLKQQASPIKEIAGLIGYGSVASFTRAFGGHFGVPPAVYRKLSIDDPPA